jgi:hypothetical protein
MKKVLFGVLILAFLVTGCSIGLMGGRHGGLIIVPVLPVTVELDADDYYYQNGYYYMYRDNIWFYSEYRQGPWIRLPRSHYPKEVHYRGHEEHEHDKYHEHD